MHSRTGRSRLKVIIVLAILGIVAGLVICGIRKVRESAALMSCSNNLGQLGKGLHSYDGAMGRLPKITDQGEGTTTGGGITSIFFEMVPYIEATPRLYHPGKSKELYFGHSSIDNSITSDDGTRRIRFEGGFVNFWWNRFIDPADNTAYQLRDIPMTLPDGSTGYYASGSYAANGQLPWGKGSISKLPANTILFAERPQVCKTAAGETIYNLWGVGFYSPHMPAFAALAPLESPESWTTGQVSPAWPLPAEANADQIRVRIGREDAAPQPQDFQRPFHRIYKDEPCDPRLPGTPHRSGMPCAMADGSVKTFSHRTTPWVFWSACTSP